MAVLVSAAVLVLFLLRLLFLTNAKAFDLFPFLPHEPTNLQTKQPISSINTNPNPSMRAWNCHGRTQRELVDRLIQAQIVRTREVRDVMYKVDRANYVPSNPYADTPQPIGQGQTISAPHMHAYALEEMYPYLTRVPSKQELKIMDVGVGSGYLSAALGRWVMPDDDDNNGASTSILGRSGKVFGIDVHQDLVDGAKRNIRRGDADLLTSSTVNVLLGDGWKGIPEEAPFDAIHVGAAAETLPHELAKQLRVGGVMIIPIGPQHQAQNLYRVERVAETKGAYNHNDYRITQLLGVRYVPLVRSTNLG